MSILARPHARAPQRRSGHVERGQAPRASRRCSAICRSSCSGLHAVVGEQPAVTEYGSTLEENAIIKARAACAATGSLCARRRQRARGGRARRTPGRALGALRSRARDGRREQRRAACASSRKSTDAERRARFRCVLALASPWDKEHVEIAEGTCEGLIARAPRGSGGFGYDPLFIVPELGGRAMAEMSDDEKNEVSHRARAARAMREKLQKMLGRSSGRGRARRRLGRSPGLLRSEQVHVTADAERQPAVAVGRVARADDARARSVGEDSIDVAERAHAEREHRSDREHRAQADVGAEAEATLEPPPVNCSSVPSSQVARACR